MSSWLSYFFPAPAAPSAPANANETREAPAASLDEYSFADAKPLGSGADAQVVAATHIPTNKRIALKLIDKPKRRPDQLDRSRFESKLITSVFDHPNIVKGLPLVENEHLLVLPMELAPMGDLLDFVNSRHGFPEPEARDIFRQLVEGLAHAHSKNVLHGDIKLENVLIFPPSKEQVKRGDFRRRFAICDWGYARYNTGEPLKKAFGSMLYSSPEIITGTGHFSTATDIWGLGVILYALIYATLPFGGKDLRQHIAAAQFSFPPQVPVSPDCKALISAIMKINPAERLTIDQIRAHPWLTGSRAPVKPILASVPHSSSSCSPLASASSSGASSSSVSLSGTADSDCAASPAQPATQLSTVCVASAADPAAPAPRAPASKPPTNGCWYLDSGDEDLDAVVRQ